MTSRRAGRSLRTLYDEQIAAHGFEPDAAQLRAIERLEDLRLRLVRDFLCDHGATVTGAPP